jgi:acyl-coenzyme A thioesterase PaaI-like protein
MGSYTVNIAERAAVATRTLGMHLYGHLLGIWCEPPQSGRCTGSMPITPMTLDRRGDVALGALASLADMAMQTSLVSVFPDKRWMTSLLQVRKFVPFKEGVVHITSTLCSAESDREVGLVRAELRDDQGNFLGDACGTFVQVPLPNEWRRLPWEIGVDRPKRFEAFEKVVFSDEESSALQALNAQLRNGAASFSELIQLDPPSRDRGQYCLSWRTKTHLQNRAGEAQGGATYGALELASRIAVPEDRILIEHWVQFLKPIRDRVTIVVEPIHSGRRLTSTISRMLDSGDRLLALGWSHYVRSKASPLDASTE